MSIFLWLVRVKMSANEITIADELDTLQKALYKVIEERERMEMLLAQQKTELKKTRNDLNAIMHELVLAQAENGRLVTLIFQHSAASSIESAMTVVVPKQ
jgi:septal ring factor EnvC (AmiA/AmiB activator)